MKELTHKFNDAVNNISRTNYFYIIYCFIISFCFITIGSKSSFLYPFNDWNDVNIIFTVGKGIVHGLVPYRDLFDHKGPYTYFLFSIAYLISNTSFLGLYFIELISFTAFLCIIYKIITLYISKNVAFIILPVFSCVIICSSGFTYSGSMEEFALPFLAYSLYSMLKMFKFDTINRANFKILVINGIIAGIIFWTKFTLIGFWFGWMAGIFFIHIYNKSFRNALLSCVYFLLGMIIATVPMFIYFLANNSLNDLFFVYFNLNLTHYSVESSIIDRLYLIVRLVIFYPFYDRSVNVIGMIILAGLFIFFISKKLIPRPFYRWALFAVFLFTVLGVYVGGRYYVYYFLFLEPFTIFFFIGIAYYCTQINLLVKSPKTIVLTFCLCFILTIIYGNNTSFIMKKKDDYAQFKFAKIINEEKDPVLLNYHYFDAGFYTTTNIVPEFKYYAVLSIENFKENLEEQKRYIKEKLPLFVVVRIHKDVAIDDYDLKNYYYEVASASQLYDNSPVEYKLYRLKNE